MNESYAVLADLHVALAAERMRTLLTEASDERLARLARGDAPSRLSLGVAHVADGLRHAGRASVLWLRKGQLAGYRTTCETC